jgi:predicted O-methyltransferase YrrM
MTQVNLGPMMPCELELLTAIVKVHRPRNCVEFGYFRGDSARAILLGLGPEGVLASYDPTPIDGFDISDPRFTLHRLPMQECKKDFFDFVFFDASHNLEHNKEAFMRMSYNSGCLVVVHDTGVWKENYFPDKRELPQDADGNYIHQPDERKFVEWLVEVYGFHRINLGTTVEPRHGLTILQWAY